VALATRNSCPVCNENKLKELFSLSYNSKIITSFLESYYKKLIDINKLEKYYYSLIECQNCDFIYQKQVPNDEFSAELYENYIDKETSLKKKDNYETKYHKKLFHEVSLIKSIFKKKNEEVSVLDFGAGWGFWINYLKKNNFDVSAFEVSETRINFLKEKNIKVIPDIEKTDYKFDFIYSEETFEHISYPKETLINLSKILKDDGFILLRFPSSFLFKFKLSKSYKPHDDCAHPLEHINLLKKRSFENMIKDSSLEIINFRSKFNFSFREFLKDIKNFFYFDSILLKKTNK